MVISIIWAIGVQYPVLPELAMILVFGMLILVDIGALFFLPRIYEAISEFTADAKRAQMASEEDTYAKDEHVPEDEEVEETPTDAEEAVANISTEDVSSRE